MTNWLPKLSDSHDPIYVKLADAIDVGIANGALKSGDKLPPQRNLAFDLGVTIGTVGRAYALARERGQVAGEMGRGTYVLAREEGATKGVDLPQSTLTRHQTYETGSGRNTLIMHSTVAPDVGQAGIVANVMSGVCRDFPTEVTDYVRRQRAEWREAGSKWLSVGDWVPDPARVLPTPGVQSGLLAMIAAMTALGDKIAFEALAYASNARAISLIGRRPIPVAIDDDGLDVDDLERVCAQQHPKALFVMPTLQNPTLVTMPVDKRKKLAEVARKNQLWIFEDNVYAPQAENVPPPLITFAPDLTFHANSFSKSVLAGLRTGWIACPKGCEARVRQAIKSLSGGLSFSVTETASRMVLGGHAHEIHNKVDTEISARHQRLNSILDGLDYNSDPMVGFIWLKVPEPWTSTKFRIAALENGIIVDGEEEFFVSESEQLRNRIRVAFIGDTRERMADGLVRLREIMESGSAGYERYS
ncbi:MAG: PLP-dependent aminotransferase family protein [Hyphomicrobiales bacterium]